MSTARSAAMMCRWCRRSRSRLAAGGPAGRGSARLRTGAAVGDPRRMGSVPVAISGRLLCQPGEGTVEEDSRRGSPRAQPQRKRGRQSRRRPGSRPKARSKRSRPRRLPRPRRRRKPALAAEKAKQIEQEKAAAAEKARIAEQEKARLAAEKAKQIEQEKAAAAEQARVAAEKAAAEKKEQLAALSRRLKSPNNRRRSICRARCRPNFAASAATPARWTATGTRPRRRRSICSTSTPA